MSVVNTFTDNTRYYFDTEDYVIFRTLMGILTGWQFDITVVARFLTPFYIIIKFMKAFDMQLLRTTISNSFIYPQSS